MIKSKVQTDKVYSIINKKDKTVFLLLNQIYLNKLIKIMAQTLNFKQKVYLLLKKMKMMKFLMKTIIKNQKPHQDFCKRLVKYHLVHKVCLVDLKQIILKAFRVKTIYVMITFRFKSLNYLVLILLLKIINLVNLLTIKFNKRARDSSNQIYLEIRVSQFKNFPKEIFKVYLTNPKIKINQF